MNLSNKLLRNKSHILNLIQYMISVNANETRKRLYSTLQFEWPSATDPAPL